MEQRNINIHKSIIYLLTGFAGIFLLAILSYQNFCMVKVEIERRSYNAQCETYNRLNAQCDQINGQINDLNRIDERIAQRKSEYFSNISILEHKILDGQSNVKIAYLTFDDGPYRLTQTYLNVLRDYDVRATFFVRGFSDSESMSTYQREYEEGHTIGNHTYSHNMSAIYKNPDVFINDVLKLQTLLQKDIGITTNIVRFPGGSSTAGSKKSIIVQKLIQNGYGYADWQAVSGDGWDRTLTPQKAYNNVMATVGDRKIVVILMHDYNNNTLGALPQIITGLREKGYILLPLFKDSVMVSTQ